MSAFVEGRWREFDGEKDDFRMRVKKMENPTANVETRYRTSPTAVIFLCFVLLGALYLRIHGLSEIDLGFDETIHTYAALSILEKGEPVMPSGVRYARSLPFTYSVALSFRLFGVSGLSARIPSIVFGVLSVLLVFFIGRKFFGTTTGLIAALLAAYLPFELVQSRSCRMYSMYQFFFLLSFLVFYKGIELSRKEEDHFETGGLNGWFSRLDLNVPFLIFAFILMYVTYRIHLLAAVFYFSVLGYLLCMDMICIFTQVYSKGVRNRYLVFSIVCFGVGVIALIIPGTADLLKMRLQFTPGWATYLNTYPGYYYDFLRSPCLFPILVFFALGSIQILTRLKGSGYYVLTCTLVPLCLHSFVSNVQRPRYIYDIFPLILIIASYGISNFISGEVTGIRTRLNVKRIGRRRTGLFWAPVSFFALVAIMVPFYGGMRDGFRISDLQAYDFGGQYNAEWHRACAYVGEHYRDGEVLIATIPLAAEFAGCKEVEYNLDNGEIDQFVEIEGERWQRHVFADAKCIIDLEDLQEVIGGNQRGWLILDALRFRSPGHVRTETRDFVRENLKLHSFGGNGTIHVYGWDNSTELSPAVRWEE